MQEQKNYVLYRKIYLVCDLMGSQPHLTKKVSFEEIQIFVVKYYILRLNTSWMHSWMPMKI